MAVVVFTRSDCGNDGCVIRHEESVLVEHFGDDYRRYMSQVRRWL